MLAFVVAISTNIVYASHDSWTSSWTESEQEFYCHSNLSSLDITTTVTDSTCDIIADAAVDWSNVANSDWELTESSSSAIDFKSANLGTNGLVGRANLSGVGWIYAATVEFNTEVTFGDSNSESNVYDLITIVKHEMGHLPQLHHNSHSGEQNTSVMRQGSDIGQSAQRTITSSDATALANKY